MARVANRFTNPENGLFYDWQINHNEEDEVGFERHVDHSAVTSGTGGLVWQQGVDEPMVFTLRGTILEPIQHFQFTNFAKVSELHTIIWRDFTGEEYEVLLTYKARRERVARNPRGGDLAPNHVWRYSMTLQVIQVLSGLWLPAE